MEVNNDAMLADLPEEFFREYGKIILGDTVSLTVWQMSGLRSAPYWPPLQESLWKMVTGPVALYRDGDEHWRGHIYFDPQDGSSRIMVGNNPRPRIGLQCWLLLAWGLQNGYRWTGEAWERKGEKRTND
jgi:hypothetical protein